MSMYVRVKRSNQTAFIYTDSSEKISDLKAKYAKLNERSASDTRLIRGDKPLEEDKSISDLKIENDDIIYAVFKKGDDWEELDIKTTKEEKKD